MMRELATLFMLLLVHVWVDGHETERLRVGKEDGYMEAHVLTVVKKIKIDPMLDYHWVKGRDIQITQGGVSGRLLHGIFHEFFTNGQLRGSGVFRFGLKHGKWSEWDAAGLLIRSEDYRHGRLHGEVVKYGMKKVDGSISIYHKGILKDVIQNQAERDAEKRLEKVEKDQLREKEQEEKRAERERKRADKRGADTKRSKDNGGSNEKSNKSNSN